MNLTKILLFVFLASPLAAQQVWYVNHSAAGTGTGNSWANALPRLQYALEAAQPGDTVWVAQGIYYTSLDGNRDERFNIPAGVAVYGGFAGHETQWSQRNPALFPTTLSGDIGVPGDIADNAYTVVYFHLPNGMTTLDGFTIRDGNADYNPPISPAPDDPRICGGGVYVWSKSNSSRLHIHQCILDNNHARFGGAIYLNVLEGGLAGLDMDRCEVRHNHAYAGGSAFFMEGSTGSDSLRFMNCLFTHNEDDVLERFFYLATALDSSRVVFVNSTFENNGGYLQFRSTVVAAYVDIEFDSCHFLNNTLGIEGIIGANDLLSANKSISIKRSTIEHNDGANGLAFFEMSGNVNISDCLFRFNNGDRLLSLLSNTARVQNSDFYSNNYFRSLINANGEVRNCNFINNEAKWIIESVHGIQSITGRNIRQCRFVENTVENIIQSESPRIISSCIFDNNVVSQAEMSAGNAINCTFYRNYPSNRPFQQWLNNVLGAIDTIRATNNIYVRPNTDTGAVVIAQSSVVLMKNNYFSYGSCDTVFRLLPVSIFTPEGPVPFYLGGVECSDNIFALGHPFQDVESGDFSLRPCSLPVNAGSNAWLGSSDTLDAAGGLRIIDGIVDMGALESPTRPGIRIAEQHIIPINCSTGTLGSIAILPDTAVGPLEFQWSNGATEPILQQLSPGMYDLTITDADGCDTTLIFDMPIAGSLPVAITVSPITCHGDTNGRITATPVYSALPQYFIWSTGAQTPTIDQLGAGQYSVEITNGLGCTGQATILMEEPDSISLITDITPAGNASGVGGSIVITSLLGGRAPYEMRWSNGSTGDRLENIPAGAYALTITDAGACSRVFNFVVGMVNAVGTAQDISSEITLYPNPATEWLHFELEHEWKGVFQLEICNPQGQSLHRFPVEKYNRRVSFQADIAALPPGLYTARLWGSAISANLKFVKL